MRHINKKSWKLRQQNPAHNSCQWNLAYQSNLAQSKAKRQTALFLSMVGMASQ